VRKIKAYIGHAVMASIAVVLLVITALDAIAKLIDELGNLSGGYGIEEIFIYVLLSLPSTLYEYIPLSSLVGCLIGLGLLAATSELLVIRAAGVSVLRIIWAVMRPVLLFIVAGLLIGEYVSPVTDQYAESRRALLLGSTQLVDGRTGVWNREGNEYMHFKAVLPNGRLYGITRLKFDADGRLLTNTFVETAIYQGTHWFEEDGVITQIGPEGTHTETFSTRLWQTEVTPDLLKVLALKPEELPMERLYTYATYLDKQGLDSGEYHLSFWQKALQPLATTSLVLIAISFIFGPLRQVTTGFRVFSGVIVGIVFRTSQDLLGPLSLIMGFSPLYAVLLPILVCFLIGVFLLRRAV
jgi:lipopolysaccharide export system permease protein